uniref:Receptor L-domain domain-containing protein n=1 Tax=Chromera velia CCMP2878 TaxID=1169474 RepID=A0A0G4FZH4_9ALVE|eukprot:Cvel_19450.t1-p1 / transcript=Cvel_19450.t1 / gene=Cvel_19450 / organism=Chromera_velia_CCMP2878 / gene_product=hypothetical protein / transcript_product=hypothetical protein / location=Cvel_scaffold1678:901-2301(+) / protein_length=373 / sequence_SO=supercontig / SO=protein_coding / is_pseudo=false
MTRKAIALLLFAGLGVASGQNPKNNGLLRRTSAETESETETETAETPTQGNSSDVFVSTTPLKCDDLSLLVGKRRLTRDILIDETCAAAPLESHVAALEVIEGLITINNTALETNFAVSFPKLREVRGREGEGGNVEVFNNTNLEVLSMDALESVNGNFTVGLWFMGNPSLRVISLPALASTGGDFYVSSNSTLTSFSVPALTSTGEYFAVYSNSALTSLSVPTLTSTGEYFLVNSNSALTSLSVSALTSIAGSFGFSANSALTSLSVPALTSVEGALRIGGPTSWGRQRPNPSLESIHLPQLEEVGGSFIVKNNQALSELVLRSCPEEEGEGGRGECLSVGGTVDVQAVGEGGTSVSSVSALLAAFGGQNQS